MDVVSGEFDLKQAEASGSGVTLTETQAFEQNVNTENVSEFSSYQLGEEDDLMSFTLTTKDLLAGNYNFGNDSPSPIQAEEDPNHPTFYNVTKPFCSELVDPSKLPEAFAPLNTIWGTKGGKKDRLKAFLGVDDTTFSELEKHCDPNRAAIDESPENIETDMLLHLNLEKRRSKSAYPTHLRWLKYKSCAQPHPEDPMEALDDKEDEAEIIPGSDIAFYIRVYVPFKCGTKRIGRLPTCSREFVIRGDQPLTDIIDNIICLNDLGLRKDVSENPDQVDTINAKELYRSNFLFITNMFYNDTRSPYATDLSEPIRAWAEMKGIGKFEHRNMAEYKLKDLKIKLGYPEVYMHQGTCEHLFTFSDVRYVGSKKNLLARNLLPKSHLIACLLCSHNPVGWVVTECRKIPYDPALICQNCFMSYLYKDGKKVCHFKAFRFDLTDFKVQGRVF